MTKTILITDDDEYLARAILDILSLDYPHWQYHLAYNGHSALDQMQQYTFDLIVLNYMMPKLSGLDVLDRMRNYGNTTPVIFTSACRAIQVLPLIEPYEAVTFLQLPFNAEHLMSLVSQNIATPLPAMK